MYRFEFNNRIRLFKKNNETLINEILNDTFNDFIKKEQLRARINTLFEEIEELLQKMMLNYYEIDFEYLASTIENKNEFVNRIIEESYLERKEDFIYLIINEDNLTDLIIIRGMFQIVREKILKELYFPYGLDEKLREMAIKYLKLNLVIKSIGECTEDIIEFHNELFNEILSKSDIEYILKWGPPLHISLS